MTIKALSKDHYAKTLSAAASFVAGESCVEDLRPLYKGKTLEEVRALTLAPFAEACGIALQLNDTGNYAGTLGWPSRSIPGVEAAAARHRRFVARIMGETQAAASAKTKEELEVPPHIAKLAKALADACNEYEQAKKLASTAVAQAFAA